MQHIVTLNVHGKPVLLSKETIIATYQWYADNARLCAEEAKAGHFFVNNPARYAAEQEELAKTYDGNRDMFIRGGVFHRFSLAFLQRAYYIQSGESVPMLSN